MLGPMAIDKETADRIDQPVAEEAQELGRPSAGEEQPSCLLDLGFEAVVEVVVDLFGQLLVVERT